MLSNNRKTLLYYSENVVILLGKRCYITRKTLLYYSENVVIYDYKSMILNKKKSAKNQNTKYKIQNTFLFLKFKKTKEKTAKK